MLCRPSPSPFTKSSPPHKHFQRNTERKEMATNIVLCNHAEEDYIDMEVISSSSSSSSSSVLLFCSSPQTREFEFQMCDSISLEKETTTSPADELFYKGKLLPLHLPPRLQMVQKLLENSTFGKNEQHSIIPLTTNSTPMDQSCNISPSDSRRVSSEFNPADYFEWSTELSGFINGGDQPKKSWSKRKFKLIKQSLLGQKLKASRAYLKSLFSKSGCSDESCCAKAAACNVEEAGHDSKGNNDYLNKYIKIANKSPSGKIGKGLKFPTLATVMRIENEGFDQDIISTSIQRKSFSGAIKRNATMKFSSSSSSSGSSSSSSSFSFNSNGAYDLHLLKRSSSASSEIEGSIEAAIAYCKESQQLFTSRNTGNESGVCSLSVPRIAACSRNDQERTRVCL